MRKVGQLHFADEPPMLEQSSTGQTYTRDAYADISLAVMHKLAERPAPARRHSSSRKLVNNCAAGDNFAGGRPASKSVPRLSNWSMFAAVITLKAS